MRLGSLPRTGGVDRADITDHDCDQEDPHMSEKRQRVERAGARGDGPAAIAITVLSVALIIFVITRLV